MNATTYPQFLDGRVGSVRLAEGQPLEDQIAEKWKAITAKLRLGTAAGYHLISVEMVPVDQWTVKGGPTNVFSSKKPDNARSRRGFLVIKSKGMDLAHKPATDQVIETRLEMVLPPDWEQVITISIGSA
jgi:hypothetical protein